MFILIRWKIYAVIILLSVCASNLFAGSCLAPPKSVFDDRLVSSLLNSNMPMQEAFCEKFIKEYEFLYGPEFVKAAVELADAGKLPHFAMEYLAGAISHQLCESFIYKRTT